MWRILHVAGWTLAALTSASSLGQAQVSGHIDCTSTPACFISNMKISGRISAETAVQVNALLLALKSAARAQSKPIGRSLVELNSPGGSVSAGVQIGRMLRLEQLSAEVSSRNTCSSACVLIFAGAIHRMLDDHGRLGLHRPYLEVPEQDVSTDRLRKEYALGLEQIRAYLKEMNVLERLADVMFAVEPERMRYLNRRSATAFGLLDWDPVYKEITDLTEARKYGLGRADFIDRRSAALAACTGVQPKDNISRARWTDCYHAGMKQPRASTSAPQGNFSEEFLKEMAEGSEPVETIDWSRHPFR